MDPAVHRQFLAIVVLILTCAGISKKVVWHASFAQSKTLHDDGMSCAFTKQLRCSETVHWITLDTL